MKRFKRNDRVRYRLTKKTHGPERKGTVIFHMPNSNFVEVLWENTYRAVYVYSQNLEIDKSKYWPTIRSFVLWFEFEKTIRRKYPIEIQNSKGEIYNTTRKINMYQIGNWCVPFKKIKAIKSNFKGADVYFDDRTGKLILTNKKYSYSLNLVPF